MEKYLPSFSVHGLLSVVFPCFVAEVLLRCLTRPPNTRMIAVKGGIYYMQRYLARKSVVHICCARY